jgi:carboxylesterase type B
MNHHEEKTPLFQRAIIESGAPTSRAVRPYDAEIHEQQFKDFLEEANCPKNLPEEKVFPFLRSLPSSVITSAQTTVFDKYNPSLRWAFQPVIDDDIISRKPLEAWLSGKWNKVPIMTGFNTNEGTMYVDKLMSQASEFRHFWRHLLPELSPADLDEIERLYPNPENDPSSPYYESRAHLGIGAQFKRIEAAYAHYAYVAPVRQTAHFTSAGQTEPVYLYHWALAKTAIGRANHADNMRYETCDAGTVNVTNAQRELAQTLHAYVTSFITKGDPNAHGGRCASRPEWKAYEQGNGKVMIFGDGNEELIGGGIGTPAKLVDDVWAKSESDFWWSKVEISQQ